MAGIRRLDTKVKTAAAVVGGGAMVALGIVGAISAGSGPAATPAVLSVGEMTMGDTATADYTETSVQTSVALPADTATPPCGFKSGC
jgi:hypothetical protein